MEVAVAMKPVRLGYPSESTITRGEQKDHEYLIKAIHIRNGEHVCE